MDEFPTDFEPGSEEKTEEDSPEAPSTLFMTETDAISPQHGPALDVVPITNLCRQVISSTKSLMLCGASDIAVSVSGSHSDLTQHAKSVLQEFPTFIRQPGRLTSSPEQILLRKYEALDSKIDRQKFTKSGLRARLRNVSAEFKRAEQNDPALQQEHYTNEGRALGIELDEAIRKLRSAGTVLNNLRTENEGIQNQIQDEIRKCKKDSDRETGRLRAKIVKQTFELGLLVADGKKYCQRLEEEIEELQPTVETKRQWLQGLERRIGIDAVKRPLRQQFIAQRKPESGIPKAGFVRL
jgi:seryl-tRNA synthetase